MTLREMTRTTGILHEAQVLQLKYWPLLAATHAKTAVPQVDVTKKICDFQIRLNKDIKPPADYDARLQKLDEAVKWLLGGDWTVRIKIKNKIMFRSGPTVKGCLDSDGSINGTGQQ